MSPAGAPTRSAASSADSAWRRTRSRPAPRAPPRHRIRARPDLARPASGASTFTSLINLSVATTTANRGQLEFDRGCMESEFHRIRRLPPYVFAEVNRMKAEARAAGQDIIDFGMGNPDMPTPRHIVEKLVE